MSRHNPIVQRVIGIIDPACVHAGFELVDVRFTLEQGGWVLRVAIDRPLDATWSPEQVATSRVDLGECERMSRELSAVLDVEDPIPQAYSLEVSSPGIDRPLRTLGHFARFEGSEAKIALAVPMATAGGERRNFRGILRGVDPAGRVAIDVDGQRFELRLDDIDTARLCPDWDAVMRGGSGVGNAEKEQSNRKPGQKPGKHASKETKRDKSAHDKSAR